MSNSHKYEQIRALVATAGPRIFAVEFIKKDGTRRVMQVQQAAAKYRVKGDDASESAKQAVATRAANNPNLLNVWDIGKKAFRSINMDTVLNVNVDGQTVSFVDRA